MRVICAAIDGVAVQESVFAEQPGSRRRASFQRVPMLAQSDLV